MRVLGLDPGTATTGFGVIDYEKEVLQVRKFGLIETSKGNSPGKRLDSIFNELTDILKETKPDIVAIEKLFFATNAKTAIRVGQAQGVLLLASQKQKVEVFEYAPGTIKKVVTGDGRADKKKVQKAVRSVLGNGVRSKPHKKTHFDNAADALAVALCHFKKGVIK